jgi:hypothetical protein
MAPHDTAAPSFKQRAKEELKNYLKVSLYLFILFVAIVNYTRLVLRQYDITDETLNFGFAIINALIIGKVILIGDMVHLGKRAHARPLYQAVIVRAVLFSLLVLAFFFLEEFIKRLIHHEPAGTVIHNLRIYTLIGRSMIVFCALILLFAFRELELILGSEKIHHIFFTPRTETTPTQPSPVEPLPNSASTQAGMEMR